MQVLGINSGNDSLEDILVFLDAFQMTFPVLLDGGDVHTDYRQTGAVSPFPLDYVIDQNGLVAYYRTEYDPEAMIAVIDALLGNVSDIDVSPTSLDFGEVPQGQSENLLVSVDNTGTGDLQIHTIATGMGDFSVNLNSLLVPPGTARSLLVTFAPSALGPQQDTLQLSSNDPDEPVVEIPLQGIGQDPTGTVEIPQLALRLGNEPNPFNPATLIRFSLPKTGNVQLTIYDAQGHRVRKLVRGERVVAGVHSRHWDGRSDAGLPLPSGVYFIRLETEGKTINHKMTLVR